MSKIELTKEQVISIVAGLPVGVFLISAKGIVCYANPKAENIFGFKKGQLPGHSIEDLLPESMRGSHRALSENYTVLPSGLAMSCGRVLVGQKNSGEQIKLQLVLTPLGDQYTLVTFIESTSEVIKPSVSNDPLTGLPNRQLFGEYSEKLCKLAMRNRDSLAILFIDLDNFNRVA